MCLSVGLMMGLTALQGVSQIASTNQEAKAQQAYYNAQAQAAEQNASIQAKKGEQMADQYAAEQQKLNDRRRIVAGQQAAAFGAAGLSGDMGSALDLSSSSDLAYKRDSNILLQNQRNDQWGNYLGVINYQNQANAARASSYNVKQQAKQRNIGTILGSSASMASVYGKFGGGSKIGGASNGGFVYQSPYQNNYTSPYSGITAFGKSKYPYF